VQMLRNIHSFFQLFVGLAFNIMATSWSRRAEILGNASENDENTRQHQQKKQCLIVDAASGRGQGLEGGVRAYDIGIGNSTLTGICRWQDPAVAEEPAQKLKMTLSTILSLQMGYKPPFRNAARCTVEAQNAWCG
jgi:hypothetical protein